MIWQLLKYDLKYLAILQKGEKRWIFSQPTILVFILRRAPWSRYYPILQMRKLKLWVGMLYVLSHHFPDVHWFFTLFLWPQEAESCELQWPMGATDRALECERKEIGLFIFCFLLLCTLSLAVASPVPNPTIAVFPPHVPLAYGWIMFFVVTRSWLPPPGRVTIIQPPLISSESLISVNSHHIEA